MARFGPGIQVQAAAGQVDRCCGKARGFYGVAEWVTPDFFDDLSLAQTCVSVAKPAAVHDAAASARLVDNLGNNLGFDRVGDEALLMRSMVHSLQLRPVRLARSGELYLGPERDPSHGHSALVVGFHDANGIVYVFVNDAFSGGGNGQEKKHVATRQGSDEGFFRINIRRH